MTRRGSFLALVGLDRSLTVVDLATCSYVRVSLAVVQHSIDGEYVLPIGMNIGAFAVLQHCSMCVPLEVNGENCVRTGENIIYE